MKFYVPLLFLAIIVVVSGDTCPDHKTRCKATQTCCSDNKGGYGCCPYKGATCCSDGAHCCPHGSDCDIAHSRCIPRRSESQGWTMIYDSFTPDELLQQQNLVDESVNATMVGKQCAGGEQSCPDKYTCCPLASGGWGCCPFKDAMCCADKVHCCPHGEKCDVQAGACVKN